MADIKPCWWRTTHEAHGWTEVDGKVVSMVDASTVLQVPPGSKVGYHHCNGVPDVSEPGGLRLAGLEYTRRDYETIVEVTRTVNSVGITFIHERRVTLDAVYERDVTETPWVEVQRITCFCCTCEDGNDWACRNHNMGFGMRPCELHGVEGQREVNPETEEEGEMPESVQIIRRVQSELRATDMGG